MALAQPRSTYQDQLDRFQKRQRRILQRQDCRCRQQEQQYTINQAKVAEAEYLIRIPELQSELLKGADIWAVPVCGARISILHRTFRRSRRREWLQDKRARHGW